MRNIHLTCHFSSLGMHSMQAIVNSVAFVDSDTSYSLAVIAQAFLSQLLVYISNSEDQVIGEISIATALNSMGFKYVAKAVEDKAKYNRQRRKIEMMNNIKRAEYVSSSFHIQFARILVDTNSKDGLLEVLHHQKKKVPKLKKKS